MNAISETLITLHNGIKIPLLLVNIFIASHELRIEPFDERVLGDYFYSKLLGLPVFAGSGVDIVVDEKTG